MKQFLILFILVIASLTASAQTTCGTKTQTGTACSRKVEAVGKKCWQHGGQTKAQASGTAPATAIVYCGSATKAGGKCKNRTKKTGERCHLHKA